MALDLGELTLRLELENNVGRGIAQARREIETLPPTVQREMVRVSRIFEDEGRKSGGRLAQGINQGLIRNSPLIVAGVGAALAAGAPVMTVAAGTLFAGIGGAAAAQTLEVRRAWTAMGRDIRDSAVEDSAVLVPVYVQMADQIGAAFQRMRPQLRAVFADSAPLIESTTAGVIRLAENAMPGLARSVAAAGPVFDGFESFLASTGQGLGDFFDRLSNHSPAAGAAFASLGDIVGDLLPILGELLGQGAELASMVLPMMSTAMGGVLSVVTALGPALPPLVAAFGAFKAAGVATGLLSNLGSALGDLGGRMQGASEGGSAMGEQLQAVGEKAESLSEKAGPILGAAIAGVTLVMARMEEQATSWAQALAAGGNAADEARAQMLDFGTAMAEVNSGFEGALVGLFTGIQGQYATTAQTLEQAGQKAKQLEAAMTPLEKAQRGVANATEHLNDMVAKHGQGSSEAEGAARALTSAERELERQATATEFALDGVTSAMVEQAAQALAAIDSGFAYRKSVNDLEDAQAGLADAIKNRTNADENLRTSQEDVERAMLAAEEQAMATATAFGQQQADLSGLSKEHSGYARIIQEETLAELYRLQSAAGPEMAAAIGQQIETLRAEGVALNSTSASAATTAQRMRDLGLSVIQVPGNKTIFIDAPTAEQKARLEGLGLTVRTLPNGRIYVTADTSPAENALAALMNQRRTIQIQAIVNTGAARTTLGGLGGGGGLQRATGGPVFGPGSETSDSIPARLSNNEHVWTAREVRAAGGHGAVEQLRQAALAIRGYASGGAVTTGTHSSPAAAVRAGTHITVTANTADERRIAQRIVEAQRDVEFLTGTR
ncbi:hypothetical protein DQ244_06070 [Blastococcus sp. TBT05-19]|uniref:hypothetical protein n=1 Tax=Blastococcus sp. TBT05-19 TaxID=2250581 RepID=UPI000DEA0F52|nr:hypothetical protein [Blastococcus sp. TBT05-19]RBY94824.1 hypothetical protein DQ244_06070 [Blastococcus sp. TBT05-19]